MSQTGLGAEEEDRPEKTRRRKKRERAREKEEGAMHRDGKEGGE